METESRKKEKRKRKSEGEDGEPRKKKHKKEIETTAPSHKPLKEAIPEDGSEKSKKRKNKKHKSEKEREVLVPGETQNPTPVEDDTGENRKEKKRKKRKDQESVAPKESQNPATVEAETRESRSGKKEKKKKKHGTDMETERHDSATEAKAHKTKDAKDSAIVTTPANEKASETKSSSKEKHKGKKHKDVADLAGEQAKEPSFNDVAQTENPKEKKKKKSKVDSSDDVQAVDAGSLEVSQTTKHKIKKRKKDRVDNQAHAPAKEDATQAMKSKEKKKKKSKVDNADNVKAADARPLEVSQTVKHKEKKDENDQVDIQREKPAHDESSKDVLQIEKQRELKRKQTKAERLFEYITDSISLQIANSEDKKRKKRKADKPVDAAVGDVTSVAVPQSEKPKKKHKKEKTEKNAKQPSDDTLPNDILEKPKEKKKKHKKAEETVEDALNETQQMEDVQEEAAPKKPFFAPANYVDPPPGPQPFELEDVARRVPIPPVGQSKPLASVCADSLSPMIMRWDALFKGVVFAYQNAKLISDPTAGSSGDQMPLAQAVDEYAAPFVWVRAEFLVFKPVRGLWLNAFVNLQNESFISFVLWNAFTGTIERKRLPRDWNWVEEEVEGDQHDQHEAEAAGELVEFETGGRRRKFTHSIGHFEDGEGNPVQKASKIWFRVWDFEPAFADKDERHFLTLEGTMLTDEEEKALQEEERKVQQRAKGPKTPLTPRRSALRNSSQ